MKIWKRDVESEFCVCILRMEYATIKENIDYVEMRTKCIYVQRNKWLKLIYFIRLHTRWLDVNIYFIKILKQIDGKNCKKLNYIEYNPNSWQMIRLILFILEKMIETIFDGRAKSLVEENHSNWKWANCECPMTHSTAQTY